MTEDEEVVTVYATDIQSRVAVIKMALDDAGIPYAAVNDAVSAVLPVDGMAVVSFEVLQSDAARAHEVLEQLGLE
ncbi:MAG: hypothetical protein ACYTFZ_08530 [Planctomycetota bacterium]|jgi:xanthine dehydrogenase iron-sulfur cluster and FAD-binding subunit A